MHRWLLSPLLRRCAAPAVLLGGLLVAPAAHGQGVTADTVVGGLLQRLEQQDRRLEELERQLGRSRPLLQPTDPSGAATGLLLLSQDAPDGGRSANQSADADGGWKRSGGDRQAEQADRDEQQAPSQEDQDATAKLEERLGKLESDLGKLSDDVEGLDEKFVNDGTSATTMQLTGRIHIDGWGFGQTDPAVCDPAFEGRDPQNLLGFRRLRLGVQGDIQQNMLYKIEFDFADGNDVAIKDAYLGWEALPILQRVQIGNQKRPYGLDALNSSRFNVFLERPYISDLYVPDARRLGVLSYGVSDNQAFNWCYGVMHPTDIQDVGSYRGDHLQLELTGRLANTIWYDEISGGRGYAHWAVSAALAHPADDPLFPNAAVFGTGPEARSEEDWISTGAIDGADHYQLLGLEGVINVGALQIVGEYMGSEVDRQDGFADAYFDGGYVYVAYFLTGEHVPWDRTSGTIDRTHPFQNFWLVNRCDGCVDAGWGAWQIAARYSQADFTDADIFGGVGESFTFGLNWYWNAYARLQFNYIDGRIDQRTAAQLANDYSIYGARFSVDF